MIKFGYKLNNKNRSLFIKYFKSMRISIVKFFLPNINTFLLYFHSYLLLGCINISFYLP